MGQPGDVRASSAGAECIGAERGTGGTETSQYLEEEKSTGGVRRVRASGRWGTREIPVVVASEPGRAQTGCATAVLGVATPLGRSSRGCRAQRMAAQDYSDRVRRNGWEAVPERVRAP
jgi:hypothetical protein